MFGTDGIQAALETMHEEFAANIIGIGNIHLTTKGLKIDVRHCNQPNSIKETFFAESDGMITNLLHCGGWCKNNRGVLQMVGERRPRERPAFTIDYCLHAMQTDVPFWFGMESRGITPVTFATKVPNAASNCCWSKTQWPKPITGMPV